MSPLKSYLVRMLSNIILLLSGHFPPTTNTFRLKPTAPASDLNNNIETRGISRGVPKTQWDPVGLNSRSKERKSLLYLNILIFAIIIPRNGIVINRAGEPEPGVFGSLEPEPEPLGKKVRSR